MGSIFTYMKLHPPPTREARRALTLFLSECSLDRTRFFLPLEDLAECEEIAEFHDTMEELMRALLMDYSLESRACLIRESLQRSVRRQCFH